MPFADFDTDFFLGELPEGNYQQFVERRLPQTRRKHFANMFADIQREYNKALAGFAASNRGVSPITQPELKTFSSFLERFPFEDKFFEQPPWVRQPGFMASPRTKYLFEI